MINNISLLADLTRLLKRLEEDLLRRIDEVTELKTSLQAEWKAARDADRTAETFETWVDQVITQAGVHWLLSCVFLRFIEDNKLVDRPWLGGTPESGNLALARDRHEAYFRANPLHSDREYLLASFREAGTLPGLHTFFDEGHNPVFRLGISGDAAMAVRQFWQQVDPNTGALAHDFTDPTWNTRFLGDLYQDLSEATRKRYALLQTPEFVEEFILDRTLTPAIREFGYRTASLIDPTCGSGHFLLGAFHRFVDEWQRAEPSRNRRDIAQKALDAVAGVDLNPFAVAISRFRLLVAALLASDVHKLSEAPDFRIHVAIGDSLLHGMRFGGTTTVDMYQQAEHFASTGLAHAYASEDLADVQAILGRQYHAVVGNPPYIVVKDAALNAAYRRMYTSCHMKYSLGAPFTERFFELALTGRDGQPAGFVGLITTNSFMKREFGSKLIEQVLPRLDLSHVLDTAGAYIPGHGTPTVILFGRHRAPVSQVVRTVMGISGEPSTPDNPALGLVWSAIVRQIDQADSQSEFVSVSDMPRVTFARHPWSIGGGGASDLKEIIEAAGRESFGSKTIAMGFFGISAADEVMLADEASFRRRGVEPERLRPMISGDELRDWSSDPQFHALFPYDNEKLLPIGDSEGAHRWLWPARSLLGARTTFSKRTYLEEGRPWWEWHQIALERIKTPLTLTFAHVATHNHFVLDRGGRVFNRSAPMIKLRAEAGEAEHLGLLGLLNSSLACFWLKQVGHNKGSTVDQHGARQRTAPFEDFFEFTSTKIAEFPLCTGRPEDIANLIDSLAHRTSSLSPAALLLDGPIPTPTRLQAACIEVAQLRRQMIAAQEELDWRCYRLYGLLPSSADSVEHDVRMDAIEINLGERAFEIVLARRLAAGTEQTTWFKRHGSSPVTEIPVHWPDDYRAVVQRRIDLIEHDRNIGLIERPEHKRRWNTPSWQSLEQAALRDWLLARLESRGYWPRLDGSEGDVSPQVMSTSRLADIAGLDSEFMQIAALYTGHADFDLSQLIADLIAAESVPSLPVLRYTDTGLRKRAQWEDTWAAQRCEDSGEAVGSIPVPPKYQTKDFIKPDFWRLRGGLDVPKERWVSFPGCERGADTSLPIAWAGWDHLQQATALAAYYLEMKESEGWEAARLQPLLAGLLELVPWLEQWHNEVDPVYGERMGTYYKGFVSEEARSHGFTLDDLRGWKPAAGPVRRGRRRAN
jgi:hypothetical protein